MYRCSPARFSRVLSFPEKLLAQFLVGFGQQFFMGFPAFFLEFRVEIVRVGFEQRPEHLLVAVDDVVQHFLDRRIAFAQRIVFLTRLRVECFIWYSSGVSKKNEKAA